MLTRKLELLENNNGFLSSSPANSYQKVSTSRCSCRIAQILLLELCNMNYTDLYLNYESEIDDSINQQFQEGIKRLLENEPLQYILGYQWFYGHKS